jgi:quercetin dioxygenase-like cupin family protein
LEVFYDIPDSLLAQCSAVLLVTVLEGQMEFEVAGVVHHPEVGEELLIPAGAVHSARNVGTTTARWLYGYKHS